MKYHGIEIFQDRVSTKSKIGMHVSFDPTLKDFQLECWIERWVDEAASKGFETIYIGGAKTPRIARVIEIMLERAEDEARSGGVTFPDEPHWSQQDLPSNVIHVCFRTGRRVAA